jgi:hypothetical protein
LGQVDHVPGAREEMGRSSRHLTTLAVARRTAVTLVSALLLAGCFGAKTPAENAADYARVNASAEGLTVKSVSCSPRGEVAWTCKGRLRSGREFTCSVGPTGRVAATVTCTAQTHRP